MCMNVLFIAILGLISLQAVIFTRKMSKVLKSPVCEIYADSDF